MQYVAWHQNNPTPPILSISNLSRFSAGLNMVLLIQVPLKQKEVHHDSIEDTDVVSCCVMAGETPDVEDAVIGHGPPEGPFTEIDGLEIERDDRYPVRGTVQFYKAISNGAVNAEDMAEIAAQVQRVYHEADYVGSLVLEESDRPTEHAGPKQQPPDWWERFWERHFANTGQTREEAIAMLEKLLGREWSRSAESAVEAAMKRSAEDYQS